MPILANTVRRPDGSKPFILSGGDPANQRIEWLTPLLANQRNKRRTDQRRWIEAPPETTVEDVTGSGPTIVVNHPDQFARPTALVSPDWTPTPTRTIGPIRTPETTPPGTSRPTPAVTPAKTPAPQAPIAAKPPQETPMPVKLSTAKKPVKRADAKTPAKKATTKTKPAKPKKHSDHPLAGQPSNGKDRQAWQGHAMCTLLRLCGKRGYSGAKSVAIMKKLGMAPKPGTVSIQVGAGRRGDKEPAKLDKDQAAKFNAVADAISDTKTAKTPTKTKKPVKRPDAAKPVKRDEAVETKTETPAEAVAA